MSNTNTLTATKFANNFRIISGTYLVADSDSELLCDTSTAPVVIELALIPQGRWSTQYKLYVKDNYNNASVNNITINAPSGYLINGLTSYIISANAQAISIFIASDINYGIANAVDSPVTSQVSDETFGPTWLGVTGIAPSKNTIYNKIITIGAGFGNTAYVRTGGNDTTAVIGNILMPFLTVGAAVVALGVLPNSALVVDSGSYTMNDANAPFGLRFPSSSYDIFLQAGCTITYTGTYGFYISDALTTGGIYGLGRLINNGTSITQVNGVSGHAFNVATTTLATKYLYCNLVSNTNASTRLIRISSSSVNTNALFIIDMQSGFISSSVGKTALTIDGGAFVFNNATITTTGVGATESTLVINTLPVVNSATFNNCVIGSWGKGVSGNQDTCVEVRDTNSGTSGSNVSFKYCTVYFVGSNASSKLFRFYSIAGTYNNWIIQNCYLKSRTSDSQAKGGNGLYSDNAISIKIIDTYETQASGGAAITNLITTGSGLIVEPNL